MEKHQTERTHRRFSKKILCLVLLVGLMVASLCSTQALATGSKVFKADLAFFIDSTGSMSPYISSVRSNLLKFSEYLIDKNVDARFSVVEFRDITVDETRKETVIHTWDGKYWTSEISQIESTLSSISVDGGGDDPETPTDALKRYPSDFRKEATKFAFLLTDASSKGKEDSPDLRDLDSIASFFKIREIYCTVVSKKAYEDHYRPLYGATGGTFIDIESSDYYKLMIEIADWLMELGGKLDEEPTVIEGSITWDDLVYKNLSNSTSGMGYSKGHKTDKKIYQLFFSEAQSDELYDQAGTLNGACGGFGRTAAMYNMYHSGLSLSSMGVTKVGDLTKSSTGYGLTAPEIIEAFQVSQKIPYVMDSVISNDLDALVDAVKEGIENAALPAIGVFGMKSAEDSVGHCLIGYKIEHISDTETWIYVYDCNYREDSTRHIVLTRDEEGKYTSWYYKINDIYNCGTGYANPEIRYTPLSALRYVWSKRNGGNLGTMQMTTVKGGSFTISNSAGKQLGHSSGNMILRDSGDIRVFRGTGENDDALPLFYSRNTNLTITNTGSGSMTVNTAGMHQGAFVKTNAKSVSFDIDSDEKKNLVHLDATVGDTFTVTLYTDKEDAPGKEKVKISGTCENPQVEIGMEGSDVVYNNCTDVKITVNDKPVKDPETLGKNINLYKISLKFEEATYTGDAIKPGIKIEDQKLKKGTDYKLSYVNNIGNDDEETIASVVIEGIGEYNGIKTLDFVILPGEKDLKNGVVTDIADQVYTGKKITPKITVKYNGRTLKKGKDYKISYKNNKKIGTATITVTGKGRYSGKKKVTFQIIPKAVKLSSLKAGAAQLTAKWGKGKNIDGYEVQYSLKKNFKGAKTVKVTKASKTSTAIRKLKGNTKYYVRVRAYKKAGGNTYYSKWSKARNAKVKAGKNPEGVKLSTVKGGPMMLTVKWARGEGINGYEIQYSLKKDFKSAKTVKIKKASTTKTEIKKLTPEKKYYVRIRTYKTVDGKTYYSDWSESMNAKVVYPEFVAGFAQEK